MEAKEDSSHNQKVASKTNNDIQNCTKKSQISQMNENSLGSNLVRSFDIGFCC